MTTKRCYLPGRLRDSVLPIVIILVLAPCVQPRDLSAAPIVTIQAQVLLASNQTGVPPDPRLASLIAQLRTALPYSSFQLVSAPRGRAALGQSWKTELPGGDVPGGRMLELTPMAIDRAAIQIRARVVHAKIVQGKSVSETLVDTTLKLQSGGLPVVIGGPQYQNGVLVIVISASVP